MDEGAGCVTHQGKRIRGARRKRSVFGWTGNPREVNRMITEFDKSRRFGEMGRNGRRLRESGFLQASAVGTEHLEAIVSNSITQNNKHYLYR